MKPDLQANWARVGQVSLPATLMIDHFADVGKLIEAGKGAKREIEDILQSVIISPPAIAGGELKGGAGGADTCPVPTDSCPPPYETRLASKSGHTVYNDAKRRM